MLAIEWIWLLIGTAVVFAHLVEAWAIPYLPALWMIGVLALFLVYRLGIAVREVYWPEPEREDVPTFERRPPEAVKRHGGDGIVSTTEWVPPHIRGRKARPARGDQPRRDQTRGDQSRGKQASSTPRTADASPGSTQPVERLELPAASGNFDGAEIATVFAEVDEDTEPQVTEQSGLGIPFQTTSIVRVDKSDLRPETEADLSQDDLIIPSFAESALSGDERKRVIEAVRRDEVTVTRPGPRRPARSDADTVTQPGPKRPARSDADTVTQPGPKPPAAADDDTSPMRVKQQRQGNGDDEERS